MVDCYFTDSSSCDHLAKKLILKLALKLPGHFAFLLDLELHFSVSNISIQTQNQRLDLHIIFMLLNGII